MSATQQAFFLQFFATISFAALALALAVACTRKPRHQRNFHLLVLVVAFLFWWVSELLAVRFGKYQYTADLRALPFRGVPSNPDLLYRVLAAIAKPLHLPMGVPHCPKPQESWNIPVAVVALEAAIAFGLFRLALRIFKREEVAATVPRLDAGPWTARTWARVKSESPRANAAIPAGALMALLAVNLDAVLDPVVSTSQWCAPGTPPNYPGLNFGIWTWLTNERSPGYWFGVPLVNYIGWFLLVGLFGWYLRRDAAGPHALIQGFEGQPWYRYVFAGLKALLIVLGLEIAIKLFFDLVLQVGPALQLNRKYWQFGVVVLLLAVAAWRVVRGRVRQQIGFDKFSIAVHALVLFICGLALVLDYELRGPSTVLKLLWTVWVVTTLIAATIMLLYKHKGEPGLIEEDVSVLS